MRGFISHIHEESEVAQAVRDWFHEAFGGELRVFVSSADMEAGNWFNQLQRELDRTDITFVLLSEESRNRSWINFESGCAFLSDDVDLIPLCHGQLDPTALEAPYSFLQAYNLTEEASVGQLAEYIADKLDVATVGASAQALRDRVAELDRSAVPKFNDLEELRSAEAIGGYFGEVDELTPVPMEDVRVWDELDLRVRKLGPNVLELSGYCEETMGFGLDDLDVPGDGNYLVVQFENTEAAQSMSNDQFLKLTLDRQVVSPAVPSQIHDADSQFSVRVDGYVSYELPPAVKHRGTIQTADFAFWGIRLQSVVLSLYWA